MESRAVNILHTLQKLAAENENCGPERLMEILPEGAERSYVSRLLISSQFIRQYDEENLIEKMAEEMLVWLVRHRFKKEITQLSEDIREAQLKEDQKLLEELLHKKAELNKYLGAMDTGDN